MVLRMQYSGYGKRFRYEVVRSALNAYRKIVTLDQQGVRPIYRQKEWKRTEREKEKREKKTTWYKTGGYSSVIFVPTTPLSELKRILEKNVKESGIKIKIVETAGMNAKRMLQRSNPFKEKTCEKEDCMVCRTGGKGPCGTPSVTYEIKCKPCGHKYVVLKKHCIEKHQGILQDFMMNVTGTFHQDPMLRQITDESWVNGHQEAFSLFHLSPDDIRDKKDDDNSAVKSLQKSRTFPPKIFAVQNGSAACIYMCKKYSSVQFSIF
ncbi:hypothetical protein QZH41_003562 [Actinostola sp. cb2023]|nr:hypothetical protein QZH41_003562 [Actinostola sp. cb2023]